MNTLHEMISTIGTDAMSRYDFSQTRTRDDGSKIDDYFTMEGSRYTFDGLLSSVEGWEQFDTNQDRHGIFGIWINRDKSMTVTYVEGELQVKYEIPDMDIEYQSLVDYHGPPPPAFTVYDADGTVTKHYSRPLHG